MAARVRLLAPLALAAASLSGLSGCGDILPPVHAAAGETVVRAPVAARKAKESGMKTAVFAGGCFWGVEAVFSHVPGVTSVVSGYHGGSAANANYKAVSGGITRHAESVRIRYDSSKVRYDQLLRILFSVVADPTLKNRQGPDVGEHYRAAIVPLSREQRVVAKAYLGTMAASGKWSRPIAARIEAPKKFYPAEEYHQDFAHKNPRHPYIRRWDAPKVAALKRLYPRYYRASFQTG